MTDSSLLLQHREQNLQTFVTFLHFQKETILSVHRKLRERKSLFTLSEWSRQDILRVLCGHDGWLYFQCSQRRKIYLAEANIFFGRWEAGLSCVVSCRVESFMKCSYGGEHVVLAAWLTGVSSAERVTHSKVTWLVGCCGGNAACCCVLSDW